MDGTHLQGQRLEGMLGQLADEVRPAALCIPRSSLICFPAGSSAGRLRIRCALSLLSMPWRWPSGGKIGDQLIHHSDRGVPYTSIRYAERLADIGAVRSVGSKGDSYDNAAAKSVNSLYKKELVELDGPWDGVKDVTFATMEWVAWYNSEQLHSSCGYITPKEVEENYYIRQDALRSQHRIRFLHHGLCDDGASRPRARGRSMASARLCAPSFSYACRICVRTVFTDTDSWPAFSGADRLVGRKRRTRVSLPLSGSRS